MSWSKSKTTELFKTSIPLIQAPMAGGVTTAGLIAAVSNSGGLGSLGAGYMAAADLRTAIKQIRQLTNKPFAVNLFIPEPHDATAGQIEQAKKVIQNACADLRFNLGDIKPPYAPSFDEQMNVIVEEKIPVFSFTFGIPSEHWIEQFKKNNIKLIGTATSLEEAKLLASYDIDIIVAQGREAGGHRGTFLGKAEDSLHNTLSMISLFVEQIRTPIIAAGGIMDAAGIIKALNLGACGVQMGTAFLCCPESGAHPFYKKLLLSTAEDNTVLTRAFSGKLARGISNKFITRMQQHENNILAYPIQNSLTNTMRKEASKQNNTDFMSLWAGQSHYLCSALPAAQLMQKLTIEVETFYSLAK